MAASSLLRKLPIFVAWREAIFSSGSRPSATEGINAFLTREKPGSKEEPPHGVLLEIIAELEKKLKANEFSTVVQAQRWLSETHEIERPYTTVWVWLKKFKGVLLVPRPSHSKKDPAASVLFREELGKRIEDLKIPAGSKVKIWVMDEALLGLHTEMQRL